MAPGIKKSVNKITTRISAAIKTKTNGETARKKHISKIKVVLMGNSKKIIHTDSNGQVQGMIRRPKSIKIPIGQVIKANGNVSRGLSTTGMTFF